MCTSKTQISQWKLWNTSLKTQSSELVNKTMNGVCPVCTPLLGQWIPWIWSQVSSQKHSAVWRNQVECGAYSNPNIQNISRRNGLPAYMCKTRSQHARMGVCHSMNMSKHQAKVPSTVLILCIICLWSWTWGKQTKWKGNMWPSIFPKAMETCRHPVLNQ